MQTIFKVIRHQDQEDEEAEDVVAKYAEQLLIKFLMIANGQRYINRSTNFEINEEAITFEEVFFVRILFEFSKWSMRERQTSFVNHMESIMPEFDDYQVVFQYILEHVEDRHILSEWLKFSLQVNFLDQTIRNNLVSLIFSFIGEIKHSYRDYRHLLKFENSIIEDNEENIEMEEVDEDQQFLTLEIRQFNELVVKDVEEYMKPFSYESFVRDTDDVCLVAVMIAKKLSSDDEAGFSLQMLQTISDIREPLEERVSGSNVEEVIQESHGFGLHTQVP